MAMFKKRNYRKKVVPTKKRAVGKALRKNADKKITKVVNKVLSRKVETKLIQQNAIMSVSSLQATTTQTQFLSQSYCLTPQGNASVIIQQLYPVIGEGIGQDQRVGDECTIKSHYFDYIVNANPYDAATNTSPQPHILTMYFIKPKNNDAQGLPVLDIVASSAANFFENQSNTDSGLGGTFFDHLRKVDRDNYQVIATRTHKMGYASALSTSNNFSVFPVNDYKQFVKGRVVIPKYTWKVDRNQNHQGRNIFVFATVTLLNGSVPATNQRLSNISFNHSIYYTDM